MKIKPVYFGFLTSIFSLFLTSAFAASTVVRSISPSVYAPGLPINVTITITPDPAVLSYGVEETPPAGWTLSTSVSGAAVFPGLIKFPVQFDNQARTYTYIATPPAGSSGIKTFAGTASFNGISQTITGITSINPDGTAPTVSIVSPINGATVAGTLTISGTASDNIAVSSVQFRLDGVNLGTRLTAAPYTFSWNTTGVTNGSHILTLVAWDAMNNTTTSSAITVTVDNLAPTVSIVSPLTGTTVAGTLVISGTASDNISVSSVQFRLDGINLGSRLTAVPYTVPWNTTGVTNGSHILTLLAWDSANNTTTSSAITVTVDNAAPTVSIVSPLNGATVAGTLTISGTASDNIAVSSVQFRLDGVDLGTRLTAAPFTMPWNTTGVTNGSHVLTLVAWDAMNNTTTSSAITVTVDNLAPTVSIVSPLTGATVAGTLVISGTASDNIAVSSVQFRLDGVNLGTRLIAAPFTLSWNTTGVTNGSHILTLLAWDSANNTTTSSAITVTVDNSAPTVSIVSPLNGASVLGTITISGTASDNVAVSSVQFRLDGVNLGTRIIAAPYTMSWNTTGVANGSHILTLVAWDALNNSATSSAITVTVNNIPPHPADSNPMDFHMSLDEATNYGFCWRSAPAIPSGCPVNATLNYATRAAALWNSTADGIYHYDPSQLPPLSWVPGL